MTHDDIWQVRFRQATRRVQELEEEVARLKASAPTLGQAVEQTVDRERWKKALSFAKGIISRLDTTEVMRSSVSGIAYDAAERAVFIRNLATEALAAPAIAQPQAAEPKGLKADDVEWVVNDIAELGVKIGNQFFFLYKGYSLVYEDTTQDDGTPMHWRHVFKREFGECAHPINYADPTKIGTVSLEDSEDWKPLPLAKGE